MPLRHAVCSHPVLSRFNQDTCIRSCFTPHSTSSCGWSERTRLPLSTRRREQGGSRRRGWPGQRTPPPPPHVVHLAGSVLTPSAQLSSLPTVEGLHSCDTLTAQPPALQQPDAGAGTHCKNPAADRKHRSLVQGRHACVICRGWPQQGEASAEGDRVVPVATVWLSLIASSIYEVYPGAFMHGFLEFQHMLC